MTVTLMYPTITQEEEEEARRRIQQRYPEWWADPHYRLHRQYGWTPKVK